LTPTSGSFLLDTNVVIALMEGDENLLASLDRAREVFVPAVVLGELFFGAARSARASENAARVERFAAEMAIVSSDIEVAREYGLLKQTLKAKGQPIPENDIWIAACARRYGMVLVTRDRHFDHVEDLQITDWSA
jgi:tRNA(fMet)-specific endonuclease VapC